MVGDLLESSLRGVSLFYGSPVFDFGEDDELRRLYGMSNNKKITLPSHFHFLSASAQFRILDITDRSTMRIYKRVRLFQDLFLAKAPGAMIL